MNRELLQKNLEAEGFSFSYFETGAQAVDYLVSQLKGRTIGVGGSVTLEELGLCPRLEAENTVFWHWNQLSPDTLWQAAQAEVYLTSVNAIAETGELINIDGSGNRIAASLWGKDKVYFIAGVNKVAADFDAALWRARNVAAPLNARRLNRKTPCAIKDEIKCYNCKSPERNCRGLCVLWRKMTGVKDCEVVLINEALGF